MSILRGNGLGAEYVLHRRQVRLIDIQITVSLNWANFSPLSYEFLISNFTNGNFTNGNFTNGNFTNGSKKCRNSLERENDVLTKNNGF